MHKKKRPRPLDNISTATLKRTSTLIKNAEKIGIDLGDALWDYDRRGDVIIFMLENSIGDLCIITCSKWNYLSEILRVETDSHPFFDLEYYYIKNIRTFLFHLKREDFSSLLEE